MIEIIILVIRNVIRCGFRFGQLILGVDNLRNWPGLEVGDGVNHHVDPIVTPNNALTMFSRHCDSDSHIALAVTTQGWYS